MDSPYQLVIAGFLNHQRYDNKLDKYSQDISFRISTSLQLDVTYREAAVWRVKTKIHGKEETMEYSAPPVKVGRGEHFSWTVGVALFLLDN